MIWHRCAHWIPVIYALLLAGIITCLFTRAFTDIHSNLIDHLHAFDYPRTYVELYFLLLFDSFLFIFFALIFAFKCCRWLRHGRHTRLVLMLFQVVIYAYSLSKFLVFYDWTNVRSSTAPYQLDRFDVLTIVFIPLLALVGMAVWAIFFRLVNAKQTDPERRPLTSDRSTTRLYTEEADPLLVEGESRRLSLHVFRMVDSRLVQGTAMPESAVNLEETKELKVQIKESSGSWWRIIKLGKEEWKLYIIAFAVLIIAALSKGSPSNHRSWMPHFS